MSIALSRVAPLTFQAAAASKPVPEVTPDKILRIIWNVVSVIIFPIGLARLAIYAIRTFAAYNVVPLAHRKKVDYDALDILRKSLIDNLRGERTYITTPDGIKLDSVFFEGKQKGKVILYAPGNHESYESCEKKIALLKETGASVFMINRSGVVHSEGFPTRERLATDIYTAYEYLIHQKKFDPNYILGFGFSQGSADINCGAALIQEKYPHKNIMAVSERAYSRLSLVVQDVFNNAIIGKIVALIVQAVGWEIDNQAAWNRLKGRKCLIYHPLDGSISTNSALYKSLNKTDLKGVKVIQLQDKPETGAAASSTNFHCREFNDVEKRAVIRECQELLGMPIT